MFGSVSYRSRIEREIITRSLWLRFSNLGVCFDLVPVLKNAHRRNVMRTGTEP